MGYISGFVRDRLGNLAPNVKVRAYKRSDGSLIGEAITGDGVAAYVAPDPHYDYVYLNLDMSGADNSNTFKDLSSYKNPITTYGDTKLKTNTGLFTGPAIYLDGNGDYLATIAPTIDGDFTLEADVYYLSIGAHANLVCCRSGANIGDYLFGVWSGNKLGLLTNGLGEKYATTNYPINLNTLNKLAIVRKDGVFSFYINGNKDPNVYLNNRILTPANKILRLFSAIDPLYWQGYVKFFRLTKYARYSNSYALNTINYGSSSGSSGGPLGYYSFNTTYTGEVTLLCLDTNDQYFFQDLSLRTKAE